MRGVQGYEPKWPHFGRLTNIYRVTFSKTSRYVSLAPEHSLFLTSIGKFIGKGTGIPEGVFVANPLDPMPSPG